MCASCDVEISTGAGQKPKNFSYFLATFQTACTTHLWRGKMFRYLAPYSTVHNPIGKGYSIWVERIRKFSWKSNAEDGANCRSCTIHKTAINRWKTMSFSLGSLHRIFTPISWSWIKRFSHFRINLSIESSIESAFLSIHWTGSWKRKPETRVP